MLIVIATKEELKLVEELGYSGYPVLITGVGAINVINALKDLPEDTYIVNIGYAGSNKLEVGTQVEVGWSYTYHPSVKFEEKHYRMLNGSSRINCYTSTDFVTQTDIEEPCVFDMELAFITAMFNNVRAFKVVSDNLSLKEYEEKIK
jgi:hypothetical protein